MKEFVEVIQGEGHCLIGLLSKDIGGQTCKKRRRNMSRNVINARGLHPIFISLDPIFISLEGAQPSFWSVAFCSVGHRYCGSIPQGCGKQKISPGMNRLFH